MHRNKPHTYASHVLRSRDAQDRRFYHRFDRHGVMARVGTVLVEIDDISIGGLRMHDHHGQVGEILAFQIIPREGRGLDMSRALWVKGEILGQEQGKTRIRFTKMTYALAKFLIGQLARMNGVEPYIFK